MLSYVERPCIPREIAAPDELEPSQKQGLSSSQLQPSGGDNKCRLDVDGSGVSPAHCSPCYVSSALNAGDRPRPLSGVSAQVPDTAAELMQLSALIANQLETAALSGCGSIIKQTTAKLVMRPVLMA